MQKRQNQVAANQSYHMINHEYERNLRNCNPAKRTLLPKRGPWKQHEPIAKQNVLPINIVDIAQWGARPFSCRTSWISCFGPTVPTAFRS
jgi:hypothetical protein